MSLFPAEGLVFLPLRDQTHENLLLRRVPPIPLLLQVTLEEPKDLTAFSFLALDVLLFAF